MGNATENRGLTKEASKSFVLLDMSMCKSTTINRNSNNNNSNNNKVAYTYLGEAYEMNAFWSKSNIIGQSRKTDFFSICHPTDLKMDLKSQVGSILCSLMSKKGHF